MIIGELKPNPVVFQNISDRQLLPGDCLYLLQRFPSNFFDLIYLDPPFNSKEFYNVNMKNTPEYQSLTNEEKKKYDGQTTVFDDTWTWDTEAIEMFSNLTEKLKYGNIISDLAITLSKLFPIPLEGEKSSLSYYVYMIPRLKEMYRVLSKTGSIYLHCDPTASHYLKIIMDKIFSDSNFRNEIIWHYTGGLNAKKTYPWKHDIILFYSKSDNFIFNIQRQPYADGSGYAKNGIVSAAGKKYNPNSNGKPIDDVWYIPIINPMAKERLGYPTQKPEELLERIILSSSEKYGRVLDPFCGGGTTLDVAERLNRKYIGMEVSKIARTITLKRLEKYRSKWNFYHTDIQTSIETLDERSVCSPKEMIDWDKIRTKNGVECWVREVLDAEISPKKKGEGADGGIDGLITSVDEGKLMKIALGITTMDMNNSGLGKFNQFPTNIDNRGCDLGIFISDFAFKDITPSMKETIKTRGKYKDTKIDIIQVVSFEQLKNGYRPYIPGKPMSPTVKPIKQIEFPNPVQKIKKTMVL